MKAAFFITLLYVFSFGGVQAQCPPGDVYLGNQEAVDEFIVLYPNCTEIEGGLTLGNSPGLGSQTTSLAGLQNIEIIHGTLSIYELNYFAANDPCFSLGGLSSLHSIGGLSIMNSRICGFQGLSNLEFIGGGGLKIENSHGFSSFDGLENVTSIEGQLQLWNLPVYGDEIGIENFQGLNNLISIGGLYVEYVPTLQDFSGLENLQYIGVNILITWSSSLTSLAGLNGVLEVGGDQITIGGNSQLSYCSIPYFCLNPTPDSDFTYTIMNNLSGCNSLEEIFEYCSASSCSGDLYADQNCNGIFDEDDVPVSHHLILANSDPFAFSNNSGSYTGWIPADQLYQIFGSDIPGFSSETIEIQSTGTVQTFENVNIGLCPDSLFANLSVSISPLGVPNPGFNYSYNICVNNIGTVPADAILTLDVSGLQAVADIISLGGGALTGNIITWNISDLALFETVCFQITSQINVGTPLGTLIELFAYVSVESGTYTEYLLDDNEHRFSHEVVGSFDPNDKEVNITTIDIAEDDISDGVSLEYLIRFQNTGTYPATFVRVIDVLPTELNPATIQMLSASHDYELIFHASNKLEWFFDEINLADSTSNEPESHGYIHFRISTHPNLVVDESINNRVSIYFDYNAPVITNYAITNIGQCINVQDVSILIEGSSLLVDTDGAEYEWFLNGQAIVGASGQSFVPELSGNYSVTVTFENGCEVTSDLMMVSVSVGEELESKVLIYPNPANQVLNVVLPLDNWTIVLFDVTGKQLTSIEMNNNSNKVKIDVQQLLPGLYFVHCQSKLESITKPIIIQH